MFRDKMRSMTEEQRNGRFKNIGDPGRRVRFISTYEEGEDSVYVAQGIFAFEKMFREMEIDLAAKQVWLVGDFSLADINLTPFVARLEYLGLLDIWIAERPFVQAWWARAKSRPSFKAAIADKLTAEQISSMRVSGARIKDKIASRWRAIVKDAVH
jgi:glutathione S-transferase